VILGVLIIMVIVDGFLTNALIQRDIAREGNPFLTGVAGKPGLLIIKTVGVLLAAFILWDIHRRLPRLALWAAAAFLLIYSGIVAWNLRLLLLG
jgi:hypothetical protein